MENSIHNQPINQEGELRHFSDLQSLKTFFPTQEFTGGCYLSNKSITMTETEEAEGNVSRKRNSKIKKTREAKGERQWGDPRVLAVQPSQRVASPD